MLKNLDQQLKSIYQELQTKRSDQIIVIILTIDPQSNGSLGYECMNVNTDYIDYLLSQRVNKGTVTIDKTVVDLVLVSRKLKDPRTEAFYLLLNLGNNQYHCTWLFNAPEDLFCKTIKENISKYY